MATISSFTPPKGTDPATDNSLTETVRHRQVLAKSMGVDYDDILKENDGGDHNKEV